MSLKNELTTKELITLFIRSANEFREDFEVWLLNTNWMIGCFAVLKHEEITKKWLWTFKISSFPVCRPQVKSAAHGFLSPVVEVIAEGRTNLRFCLYCSNQYPFSDNNEVPFLRRSEESREFDGCLSENVALSKTCLQDQFSEEINKSIHLCTTGYGTSQALICLAALLLPTPLSRSCLPVMGNSSSRSFR